MNSVRWGGTEIYPTKIVCVGRNYAAHIRELDNQVPDQPVFFIKPNSSISTEIYSSQSEPVHYEGEICFLVYSGQLAGVGFGLDLTKRALQSYLKSHGLPWERSKSFDKSAVFTEFVDFNGDTDALRMELYINDKLVQHGGSDVMLNKPQQLLTDAKTFLSLEDGDILMTGTPEGVGPIVSGDKFRGRILQNSNLLIENFWVVQ
jgi:2-keto-4-pentenoate hydratase/2-oxohepta-3-ene-1,7-dioic acid hydratase in catechol pathway